MEIVPTSYLESLKRYWRRRRYQKLSVNSNNIKRKMKVARLGDHGTRTTTHRRRACRIRRSLTTKLSALKVVSPTKLLALFHESYVEMMISLAGNVAKPNRVLAGKRVAKDKQISMVSNGTEERLVDSKLLLEIYKRLAASRQLQAAGY